MDNKPLEGRAENEISKQLSKLGLFVCKPYFDISGSDLLVIENLEVKPKLTIIQSKGRTVKEGKNSNVKINKAYLNKNFIVFVYIEQDTNIHEDYLYCFFHEEISTWKSEGENFVLYIPNKFHEVEYFQRHLYYKNYTKFERVKEISKTSELDFASFMKDVSLGLQAEINWRENAIFPSFEIMESIYGNYDINKSNLTQDILLYITGIIREKELENKYDDFHDHLSFEFLSHTFHAASSDVNSIFEQIKIKEILKVNSGRSERYLGYNKFFLLDLKYEYHGISSEGIYCFIKDDACDAIELILHKNENLSPETNILNGNAKDIRELIIQTIKE